MPHDTTWHVLCPISALGIHFQVVLFVLLGEGGVELGISKGVKVFGDVGVEL